MTQRKVVLAPAASMDVADIVEDVMVAVGVDQALAQNDRIEAALESLSTLADRGRFVPELRSRGISTYRELVVAPYRIIYRVEPKAVWIVAVVDHRRELEGLLLTRARRDRG